MKQVHLNGSGWRGLRMTLSLALYTGEQVVIPGAVRLLEADLSLQPLYDDIKAFISGKGCGMITESGEDIGFFPEYLPPGRYSIETGNYSSISELELFLMPVLFSGGSRSVINYSGVTHSHVSCPTVFLKETLFGILEQCGFYASMNMKRFGYYGSGGGLVESRIYPAEKRPCNDLLAARDVRLEGVRIFVAKMDMSLAEREKEFVLKNMNAPADRVQVMEIRDADGYGNSIQAYMKYGNINVILSRDMAIYNSAGDLVFDEGKYYTALGSLKDEVSAFVASGTLPVHVAAEAIPYMMMSGSSIPHAYTDSWSSGIYRQVLG